MKIKRTDPVTPTQYNHMTNAMYSLIRRATFDQELRPTALIGRRGLWVVDTGGMKQTGRALLYRGLIEWYAPAICYVLTPLGETIHTLILQDALVYLESL